MYNIQRTILGHGVYNQTFFKQDKKEWIDFKQLIS